MIHSKSIKNCLVTYKILKNFHARSIRFRYRILLHCNLVTRFEVSEVISAEQRWFSYLTFFRADSEDMKNISADQLYFRADQLWFSLNQRCSELKKSVLFEKKLALNERCSGLFVLALKHWVSSAKQRWFSADLFELALILKHADGIIKLW